MPGFAPLTPVRQEPDVPVTRPWRSSSAVASPKYHTLPCASCVYQSVVRSARRPLRYKRSSTTTQGAPPITAVRCVTVITSRDGWPSFSPTYVKVVPGRSENHGLSTRALNPRPAGAPDATAPIVTESTTAVESTIAVFSMRPSVRAPG